MPDAVVDRFRELNIRTTRTALDAALLDAANALGAFVPATEGSDLPSNEAAFLADMGVRPASRETLEAATVSTAARFATLLETAYRTSDVASRLGVGDSRVRQKVLERELYAFNDPRAARGHLFPRFQFDGARTLPGLGRVVRALPVGLHPLTVEGFFATPNPDLDPGMTDDDVSDAPLSPRQWLLAGHDPEAVAALAATL